MHAVYIYIRYIGAVQQLMPCCDKDAVRSSYEKGQYVMRNTAGMRKRRLRKPTTAPGNDTDRCVKHAHTRPDDSLCRATVAMFS